MFQITGQKKKNRAQAKPTATDVAVPTAAADPGSVDDVPPAKDAFPVGRPVFVDRDGKPQIRNYEHLPVPLPFPAEPFSTATCLAAIATHITEGGLPSDFNAAYDTRTRPSTGAGNVKLMEPELAAAASVPVSALQTPEGQRQLRSILEAVGFAIVTDVLKNEECHHVERAFGADLMSIIDPTKSASPEKLARIAEDPVHNWPLDSLSLGAKSVSDWGLPHGKAAWYCRAHPNVKATFASIFQTDRLCVGLDCLFYNPTAGHPGCNDAAESRLWPHADQNRAIRPSGEYEVYQGVLYIWPADADTSATVVWPRSHVTVYDTLMTKGNYRRHFCMLPKQEFDDFAANARRVPVPAGAMLLWNSKTVHQGWNGGARLAVPICYEPVERRSHKALQSKISCVVEGIPTTHWASLGEPHVLGDSAKPAANEDVALKHAGHSWCVDERARVKPEIFALL